jgi:hypothetical protein
VAVCFLRPPDHEYIKCLLCSWHQLSSVCVSVNLCVYQSVVDLLWIDLLSCVAGGLRQRLTGHQSKPAATQQSRVQRLSPENKGALLIYHLEQVTETGGCYSWSHT